MTHFLKLATASALALTLAACASTDDKYSVGVDDDDRFESSEDGTDVELSDAQTFGMDDDDGFETKTTTTTMVKMPKSEATIYTGTAMATEYSTVRGAIAANGLNTMLDDETVEYTVFAPNNAAFAGLDLSGVSAEDQKALLAGHVVKGRVSSSDLAMQLNNGRDYTVATAGGQTLRFYRDGEDIKVADENGYTYTVDNPDMEFANGYVHGINGVLGRTY